MLQALLPVIQFYLLKTTMMIQMIQKHRMNQSLSSLACAENMTVN